METTDQAHTVPAREEDGANVWRSNLAVGAFGPAGLCAVIAVNFIVAGARSIAELGEDGEVLFALALLLAVLNAIAAQRCVAKIRRVSRRLVVSARAVEYAHAEGDAHTVKRAVDDLGDCLAGSRSAVGRIFPRQRVARLVEQLTMESRGDTAELSEASLAVVRQIRDAGLRWQDPVA
ncbi:hypothetical protein [Streptomyces tendae]|uniref:hypothetical protein n=1 Tax=Streptomyces tendae TaxID=1932 RepID=UPI0036CD228D